MYYFTDDCLLGVEMIDNEHRELFRIIGEIRELLENDIIEDKYDRIRGMLGQLNQYAETHFKHEEEYMKSIGHPELELQKKQHAVFREKICEADITMPSESSAQQVFLDDLLRYLVTWLYRHIIGSDMMIGKMKPVEEAAGPIQFTDEYLTGISLIDKEHRELFRLIGEVHRLIMDEFIPDKYDEIVHLLDEMKEYTIFHFADEEKYMENIQYEGLEAQKRAHDAFVERLENMDLEHIDEHQQETLEELLEFLTQWLINHILNSDKKIGEK
ncbi:MAG: hemerythrin family protein [Roseburia sp.]|nr:hemerythrin family protein [Ruminococcus sp.]MCM1153785.1 hemerythrin family protein [Roseburia sp.]MCM1242734.1 hemerythrin family protein [Roseburia sp.]